MKPPPRVAGGAGALTATLAAVAAGPGLARGSRALLHMNQPGGFDCPGCAWPEPAAADRSAFEFCENGAKALAWEADRARADAAFFARHSIAELAAASDHWLGQQGRLVEPMWRAEGSDHYRPIAWDDAFALIARTLAALDSPDQALFYTSGRTSNEAAFLYQLFARELGTNNLPDCSNLCHESSGVALKQAIGVGKGTVQLDDFARADVILIIGQNPGTNHPRMMTTLQAAARRGCRIVSINPLPEVALARFQHPQNPLEALGPGTPIASMHLPVRVGGDVALLKGVMKELLEEDVRRGGQVVDHAFIASRTDGFAAFADALAAEPWDALCDASGIDRDAMRALAELLAGTQRIIACWAMGLTQHVHAIANIQEVANLLLLRGALGKPGAGLCPVRGHSNVQGDRTMGIDHRPPGALLDALEQRYGFSPPRQHGLDVVGAIEAMAAGRARLLFALGGNFLSASPDTAATERALAGCLLTAHVSTKLNRAHLATGRQALILPCLGRSERDVQAAGPQFVTVEDSMGCVHRSQGVLAPAGPALRSEPAIVAGAGAGGAGRALARALVVAGRGLRPHPRRHRRRHPRLRGHEPARARARRLRVAEPGARGALPHRRRPRPVHGSPRAAPGAGARAAAADHDPQPRSVQHDDLRPGRSLPRHQRRPPCRVHERGRHPGAGAGAGDDRRSDQPPSRRDARRAPLQGRRLSDPARLSRGVFSRGERAGAAVAVRARQPHAGVEVHRHRSDAERSQIAE